MSKWYESRFLWGGLLILGGVIFLLQSLGIFEYGNIFWAILFGLAGLFFLSVFIANRSNWWSLIPGVTLVSLAVSIGLSVLQPELGGIWSGPILLGGIGLSFLLVYLAQRDNWWALIPCGALFTLAAVAGISTADLPVNPGGILFLGMGLTFVVLALIPTPAGRQKWPWIPAVILLALAAIVLATEIQMINYLWAIALLIGGGILVVYALRPRRE